MFIIPQECIHCQFPHSPPIAYLQSPLLLTWKSPFEARGANARPHSSLVGDKLPSPCPLPSPFPLLMVPHSSRYMSPKTTLQYQVNSPIQL
jgi:hypothetical protein